MLNHRRQALRILIIEPDHLFEYSLTAFLRGHGHTVTAVTSVNDAPSFQENTVDLLIGEIEAIPYVRDLKQRGHAPRYVIIFTREEAKAVAENRHGLADLILAKPSSPRVLSETAATLGIQL